ncbi:unnamed protein product, partial [Nesidiocoris tenuis]
PPGPGAGSLMEEVARISSQARFRSEGATQIQGSTTLVHVRASLFMFDKSFPAP